MTEQLYFDDPLTLEFTAEVTETRPLEDGRFGLVMPRTYFYPTSGGQEHDTGAIGEARVLDVFKEKGTILHVADRSLEPGSYSARIDRERRLRAMQHHTAQHILSAAFLEVAGIDSLSANINGDRPSTIDLEREQVAPEILGRAEAFANAILFENRPVRSYHVTEKQAASLPFRKPAKVSGRIRVVEVDGLDITPCGGTHCPSTGMVGLLKIVRTERVNQKLRVHFVAGYQALDTFERFQTVTQEAATLLETGLEAIPAALGRKLEQLKAAHAELEAMRSNLLEVEAERLAGVAERIGSSRLVIATFRGRSPSELRALAQLLRGKADLVALLANAEGGKFSLVVSSAAGTGVDAREFLRWHLEPLGLRGGGDGSMAQGGGQAKEQSLADLFERARSYFSGAGTAFN